MPSLYLLHSGRRSSLMKSLFEDGPSVGNTARCREEVYHGLKTSYLGCIFHMLKLPRTREPGLPVPHASLAGFLNARLPFPGALGRASHIRPNIWPIQCNEPLGIRRALQGLTSHTAQSSDSLESRQECHLGPRPAAGHGRGDSLSLLPCDFTKSQLLTKATTSRWLQFLWLKLKSDVKYHCFRVCLLQTPWAIL